MGTRLSPSMRYQPSPLAVPVPDVQPYVTLCLVELLLSPRLEFPSETNPEFGVGDTLRIWIKGFGPYDSLGVKT